MKTFFLNLQQKNPLLAWAGWLNFVGFLIVLVFLFPFDNRTILGINTWVKPMKFLLSLSIYLWTFALVLDYLKAYPKKINRYSFWLATAMIIEIICILVQAIRGEASHFNITSTINGLIFNVMGIFIMINTIILILITLDFFRLKIALISPEMIWAIRLGLILMLLASFEAGFMLRINAHTVGAPDGGAGLPLLNWSTRFGDLRIAHFVGMHAIQALPILVILNQKWQILQSSQSKIAMVLIASLLIFSILAITLIQALNGVPLLKMS